MRAALGQLPQAAPVVSLSRRLTRGDLRVLAFHGVPDLDAFDRLVSAVLRHYRPVSEGDVAAAIESGHDLPEYPVWFTFDDGLRSTIDAGEVLASRDVSATAFVCPAVIAQPGHRLWFQVAADAQDQGLLEALLGEGRSPAHLKTLPDDDRRRLVASLEREIRPTDPGSVVGVADLERWRDQGHTVGNHTWDHPCLDTCTQDEQERQLRQAHDALIRWGLEPRFFAYPNGNDTPRAAAVARELGYVGSLLFDHALSGPVARATSPHQISRLRLDSDSEARRALSILSGAHSFAHHLVLR
jgi:peptidoglycan/xylan/chitin deacetylase (PgdA/CDA1 family)